MSIAGVKKALTEHRKSEQSSAGPHGPIKIRSRVLSVLVPVGKDCKIAAQGIGHANFASTLILNSVDLANCRPSIEYARRLHTRLSGASPSELERRRSEDTMRTMMVAMMVVGAFLAQSASVALAAEPYPVPVILPLSGPAAFLGTGERDALELLEKATNASGGIDGRPLVFGFQDDQSSPQLGVQLAGDVIAKKPAVMIGSSLVAICRAMAPLMQNGPVDYCLSPGIHPDKGYVFTGSVSTIDLINALVRYFRLRGWTRVAFMVSTDATGQDAENGIRGVLDLPENKGMQIVDVEHFNTTDLSVAAQIQNVRAAHPQAFIAWSTGTPIGTVFRDIEGAGLDIPIATTGGNMTYAQMKQYTDFLPKQLYIPSSQWVVRDPKLLDPSLVAAHEAFFRAFDAAGQKPDESADLAWDPGQILVYTLRKLGPKATAAQALDFIEHLTDYAGVDGIFNFEKVPQRGLDVTSAIVTKWDPKAQTWQPVSKPTGIPLP